MSTIFTRAAGIAALSVVVLGLVACGESSEEKATKKVCSATNEIKGQVKKLESLAISTSLVTEVKTSAEAIDKSIGEIKSAASDLPTANKEQFEAATKKFQVELASLLTTTLKASAGGEAALKSAEPQLKASLSKLSSAYKTAYEGLKCS